MKTKDATSAFIENHAKLLAMIEEAGELANDYIDSVDAESVNWAHVGDMVRYTAMVEGVLESMRAK